MRGGILFRPGLHQLGSVVSEIQDSLHRKIQAAQLVIGLKVRNMCAKLLALSAELQHLRINALKSSLDFVRVQHACQRKGRSHTAGSELAFH